MYKYGVMIMNIHGSLKDLKTLDVEINKLKETLYILMNRNDLTDKNVVECSQKLDELILKYQEHKNII